MSTPSSFHVFSKNGTVLPVSEATISLLNIEYSYGYGVYETLKLRNGIVYFIDQHLERLEHSYKTLEIKTKLTRAQIKTFLLELVSALRVDSCNLKIVLIGSAESQLFIFATAPLYPDRKLYQHGAQLLSFTYERMFPTAKTLNMLPSYLAYKKAREDDCYDALLTDHAGVMLEGTRTNFCLIKDKTIYKAPSQRILGGVTFLTLSRVAAETGFSIQEREIPLCDLLKYDGAFITSTSTKIMPVRQVDAFVFSRIAPSLRILMRAYDHFLDQSQGVFLPD